MYFGDKRIVATFQVDGNLFLFLIRDHDSARDGMFITRIFDPVQRKKLNSEESMFQKIKAALLKMENLGFALAEVGIEHSEVVISTDGIKMMLGAMPFKLLENVDLVSFIEILVINSQAKDYKRTEDSFVRDDQISVEAIKEFSRIIKMN